jgi:hypothetical protein
MIYTVSKKILIWALFLGLFSITYAAPSNDFSIIPESTTGSANIWDIVNMVWASWWKVIENYKDQAYWKKDPITWQRPGKSDLSLWDQLASWIMTWDTLLDYVTYIVRFLLQLWLLVWAIVMIYLWYKKITEFRDFKPMWLKYVIVWIAILWFAYAIIKLLVSMFIK